MMVLEFPSSAAHAKKSVASQVFLVETDKYEKLTSDLGQK